LIGDKWAEKSAASTVKHTLRSTIDIVNFRSMGSTKRIDVIRIARNFKLLCWRSLAEQVREIPTLVIKLVVTTFFALIIGGIYSNAGYSQKAIGNRTGLLFLVVLNISFNAVIGVLNAFPKEKLIVNRERSNKAYDTLSYFFAKFVVELPLNLLPSVIFCLILYYMVDLNPAVFGQFIGIVAFTALTGIALGLVISALVPTVEIALALGPPAVIIALLFGGFYINLSSLPEVANLIPYLSFLRWGFEALCVNEFAGANFECGNVPIASCKQTGAQVLAGLKFSNTVRQSVFGQGMLLIGFTVCAYLALLNSAITYMPLGHIGSNQKKVLTVKDVSDENQKL
jgi:ABC-type multidrug transport system permease subunit